MDANTLILVSLRRYHDVRLIQHKYRNLLYIENPELCAPIQNFAGRADDDVLRRRFTTCN